MSAQFLNSIDWTRPWLQPLLPIAKPIIESPNWREAVNAAATSLQNHRGLPIRFVPQSELPSGTGYEAFISATGHVPTRDNLHDFFNALIWLAYPRIKTRLNALQALELAKADLALKSTLPNRSSRGRVRDAATIFDENAALLVTRNPNILTALRNHEWRQVFVDGRENFLLDWEVFLFGHALLEKLAAPYKAITAHTWIVSTTDVFFEMSLAQKRAWVDAQVSVQLANGLTTAALNPLPVLGLPGWWGDQDEKFYQDTSVFRPKRLSGAAI